MLIDDDDKNLTRVMIGGPVLVNILVFAVGSGAGSGAGGVAGSISPIALFANFTDSASLKISICVGSTWLSISRAWSTWERALCTVCSTDSSCCWNSCSSLSLACSAVIWALVLSISEAIWANLTVNNCMVFFLFFEVICVGMKGEDCSPSGLFIQLSFA